MEIASQHILSQFNHYLSYLNPRQILTHINLTEPDSNLHKALVKKHEENLEFS